MENIISNIKSKLLKEVDQYLKQGMEVRYPKEIIQMLKDLKLPGANIAPEYGGLGLSSKDMGTITYELAKGWQPLAGWLGTHLRACSYVQQCGNEDQKRVLLPKMANGDHIYAHAYHEKNKKDLHSFDTRINVYDGKILLNGVKHWVTNACNAERIITVARNEDKISAIITDPSRAGITIGEELERPGMNGISLAEVCFSDYQVNPEKDFIGGKEFDVAPFIYKNESTSSVAFATRAVGSAQAILDWTISYVKSTISTRSPEAIGAIALRTGQLQSIVSSMHAFQMNVGVLPTEFAAHEAKTFCTDSLQEVIKIAVMLCGGAAYAGEDQTLSRHYRDALALLLIDTPNDVLLSRIGASTLDIQLSR